MRVYPSLEFRKLWLLRLRVKAEYATYLLVLLNAVNIAILN
jgi:hypothetical protein